MKTKLSLTNSNYNAFRLAHISEHCMTKSIRFVSKILEALTRDKLVRQICVATMVDMTIFSEILRLLCLCVVMEKGSWTPAPFVSQKTPPKKRRSRGEDSAGPSKPEWLKEWTISKGWIHNRSHLLSLGKEDDDDEESSSVSTDNIEELISIETEGQDFSLIFHQMSENYRQNFPESPNQDLGDLQLPEIYKERLLLNKDQERNYFGQLWKVFKLKKKKKKKAKIYNCKFTVNQLYDNQVSMGKIFCQTRRSKSANLF